MGEERDSNGGADAKELLRNKLCTGRQIDAAFVCLPPRPLLHRHLSAGWSLVFLLPPILIDKYLPLSLTMFSLRLPARLPLRAVRWNSSAPTTPPLMAKIRSDLKVAMRAKDTAR